MPRCLSLRGNEDEAIFREAAAPMQPVQDDIDADPMALSSAWRRRACGLCRVAGKIQSSASPAVGRRKQQYLQALGARGKQAVVI
jgi:hypothetical protein